MTDGNSTALDNDSVSCSADGKTTECDLGDPGGDTQCDTTEDRRGKHGTRRADAAGGRVVVKPDTKAGAGIIPILRTPVKRITR